MSHLQGKWSSDDPWSHAAGTGLAQPHLSVTHTHTHTHVAVNVLSTAEAFISSTAAFVPVLHQPQTQKLTSPSWQKKTHDSWCICRIDGRVVLVKQQTLVTSTLNEAPECNVLQSATLQKGEECDQQWQERETFNERSGCWFPQGNQSQHKCNFNRN